MTLIDTVRIPVDARCPGCGWPERVFLPLEGVFGCAHPSCVHKSTWMEE